MDNGDKTQHDTPANEERHNRYPFWLVLIVFTGVWFWLTELESQGSPEGTLILFLLGWFGIVLPASFFCWWWLNE